MTPDQERWAEAHTVLEQHGEDVLTFIGKRIIVLAYAGDQAGVDRWHDIMGRVLQLQKGRLQ